MSILETVDLCKFYGKKDMKVDALKNVNIRIENGEFVAIVGSSGSEKSTLLHMLGGLERSSSGIIKINEMDISKLNEKELAEYRRNEVGFIFQQFNLIPILNVRENIELPLIIGNEEIDDECIDYLINILGLKDREKHLPS